MVKSDINMDSIIAGLCGGSYTAIEDAQNITSPGYPANYPANSRCRWTIEAPEDSQILLRVLSLNISSSDVSCYDSFIQMQNLPVVNMWSEPDIEANI